MTTNLGRGSWETLSNRNKIGDHSKEPQMTSAKTQGTCAYVQKSVTYWYVRIQHNPTLYLMWSLSRDRFEVAW